jgi:metallo-beta-lactamase family protein
LRHNIGRSACSILFVGYQAHGTLGRQILDGNPKVRIHGRQWDVRARVAQIHGFSGHADRAALLRWAAGLKSPPRRLFLTHGEEDVSLELAQHFREDLEWRVSVPHYQSMVDLE